MVNLPTISSLAGSLLGCPSGRVPQLRALIRSSSLPWPRMPHPYSASDVITSGSLRRLRGSHYSAQRAELSQDALPLIRQGPRSDDGNRDRQVPRVRPRSLPLLSPSPPQPVYQPHQLIAVCFNHMAGRECGHCRQMERGMMRPESEDSDNSTETLEQHQPVYRQNENRYSGATVEKFEKPNDGGERGEKPPPPPPPSPVNFYDRRLSKLRIEMLGLWGRTSTLPPPQAPAYV